MSRSWTRETRLVAALVSVVGLGSLGTGPQAAAARPAPTILLESHAERPTAAERRLIHRVVKALGDHVESGAPLGRRIARRLGPRPRSLSPTRRSALLDGIQDASQAAYLGQWAKAIRLLRWVRREIRAHALTLAKQRPVFRALQKARTLLAMCYIRTHRRAEAWALMQEMLRAEPGLSLSLPIHGPALQQLYYRVKSQLDLKRGQLNVVTTPPGALIFLDGRNVGFSPVELPNLYTGRYDLIVVHGAKVSRLRRVRITTGVTRARIDLVADAALHTHGGAAITLPPSSHRASRERRLAARVGRRLGAKRVLLVGVQRRRGRRVLVGRVLRASDRKTLALAYVALEPDPVPRDTPARLARFLLYGKPPGPGVVVGPGQRHAGLTPPASGAERSGNPSPAGLVPAGWSLVAVGLATAVGGGVALALDGVTGREATADRPRQVYHTGRLGAGLLGGGLGVAAIGAVLLLVDALRPAPRAGARLRLGAGVTRREAWIGVGGRF